MTDPKGMEDLLKQHPIFKDFDPDMRAQLAGCASNVVFHDGEIILREGEDANNVYLIRHGGVSIEVHLPGREPLIIDTIGRDEVLGWSWMVPPYKWAFDARAIGLVRAVSLDATCMRPKCEADPKIGFEVYRHFVPLMAARMNAARLQLIDMYGNPQDYK